MYVKAERSGFPAAIWYALSHCLPRQRSHLLEPHMTRLLTSLVAVCLFAGVALADNPAKPAAKKVEVGAVAPDFKIKDANGKEINLSELTAKGPVLLRLTCG